MITSDLRRAIARAAADAGRQAADPGLRPAGVPGQYASSVAFALGGHPREAASTIAARLSQEPHIARAEVTGPGYIVITVTPQALAGLPERIAAAAAACAASDALHGVTVPAPPAADPLAAATWEEARQALAARLTARLAAAAGATVALSPHPERTPLTPPRAHLAAGGGATVRSAAEKAAPDATGQHQDTRTGEMTLSAAVSFAGADAVRFALARAMPGRPLRIDPAIIARHVLDNPAYAVRYAHARAASGVRWAATSPAAADPARRKHGGRSPSYSREAAALVDALSWLPERVAIAARRGRPDEFARYLEELASATIDALAAASHPGAARAPGADALALARAARAGLAAGLGLLEVSAPDRLLTENWGERTLTEPWFPGERRAQ